MRAASTGALLLGLRLTLLGAAESGPSPTAGTAYYVNGTAGRNRTPFENTHLRVWSSSADSHAGQSTGPTIFWSWILQVELDNVFDPTKPDQKFEVWARIKFTGPRFPHARPGDRDAIYVERLVLVKTEP